MQTIKQIFNGNVLTPKRGKLQAASETAVWNNFKSKNQGRLLGGKPHKMHFN